ncbi:MAG TPA: hypothetical protein DCG18_03830 [Richelia sp.]|nr:hypothetical protein [Richelia sp.]
MSHFSQIKTKILNIECLQEALSDLGIGWKAGASQVRGYQGQTCTSELIIEQNNGYDIGFKWNGKEYVLVTDLQYWQQNLTVECFLRRVTQLYACRSILKETSKAGFQVVEQKNNADGSIRLVVERWSS